MSLEHCMHDSLLAYVCFQHANCLLLYIVAWCPWFIYGYVVRRLVIQPSTKNNKNCG